jgi:hypothetical protein
LDDFCDIGHESVIEHLVGFVEDQHSHIVQFHEPPLEHLHKPSRRCDENLKRPGKPSLRNFRGGAAKHRANAKTSRVSKWLEGLRDLFTEFPSWNHHDSPWPSRKRDRITSDFQAFNVVLAGSA